MKIKSFASSKLVCLSLFLAAGFSGATSAETLTFSTSPNELVRTPGVGFQSSISHPPTLEQLNNCDFSDGTDGLEDAGLMSGSRYVRLLWQDFEPENDNFGTGENDAFGINMLRKILDCSYEEGKSVDLRISLAWPEFPIDHNDDRPDLPNDDGQYSLGLPNWLKSIDGFEAYWDENGVSDPDDAYAIANWDNQVLWDQHAELIEVLGREFNGHKALNAIDIGSVGYYGEWHYDGTAADENAIYPSLEKQRDIIQLYYDHFPSHPKIALEEPFYRKSSGDPEGSASADQILTFANIGWRGDSLGGSSGGNRNYFNERYDEEYESIFPTLWKTGQISTEISGDSLSRWEPGSSTADQYSDLQDSINYAKKWHVTSINGKVSEIPENMRDSLQDLARNLGFRLVLNTVEHDSSVSEGGSLNVLTQWENQGIAPPYRDYNIAFRLVDTGNPNTVITNSLVVSDLSVKGWLPADTSGVRTENVQYNVPSSVPAGTYKLEIGIVLKSSPDVVVPIVVDQRRSDFWVPIGNLTVSSGGGGTPPFPEGISDNVTVASGQRITIDALANDIGEGLVLQLTSNWSSKGGKVYVVGNKLTYTPKVDYVGDDKVWYQIKDYLGREHFGVVNITIESDPFPAGKADEVTVASGQRITIDALTNDTGAGLTLQLTSDWSNKGGSVSVVDNKLIYEPKSNYVGDDKVWYQIKDYLGREHFSVVNIAVESDPYPEGNADEVTAVAGQQMTIDVLANDTGRDLVIEALDSSWSEKGGRVVLVNNKILYTPKAGYEGRDRIWYNFKDSLGREDYGEVSIMVSSGL